jgi:hypothetical protein
MMYKNNTFSQYKFSELSHKIEKTGRLMSYINWKKYYSVVKYKGGIE